MRIPHEGFCMPKNIYPLPFIGVKLFPIEKVEDDFTLHKCKQDSNRKVEGTFTLHRCKHLAK
jgi:hypothetical protein